MIDPPLYTCRPTADISFHFSFAPNVNIIIGTLSILLALALAFFLHCLAAAFSLFFLFTG